jgi:hypothetical protein
MMIRAFVPACTLLTIAATSGALGCSHRKNAPDFSGTYEGPSTMAMTMKMPGGATEKVDPDDKEDNDSYSIQDDDGPEIKVTIFDDANRCEVKATRSGANATITPGQACTFKESDGTMTMKVSSGSVALSGDKVKIDVLFSTVMKTEGVAVTGTMKVNFSGERK